VRGFENPPKGLALAAPLPKPDCPNFGVSVLGPLIAGIDAVDPPNPNPAAASDSELSRSGNYEHLQGEAAELPNGDAVAPNGAGVLFWANAAKPVGAVGATVEVEG